VIDLGGRIALVTGGSRGIGKAIALRLAGQGADVAFSYRGNESAANATVGEIEALGRRGLAIQADVSDAAAADGLVKAVLEAFGKVDILVNNAGITRDDLIMRMSVEAFREVLETNLFGAFYMTKAVTRPMLKARSGRIVNITSVSGQAGQTGQANYSSAKAGLIGLTKATARDHLQRRRAGVRPDRAHPGPAGGSPGADHRGDPARPVRDPRGGRERGRLPRQRRRRLHHGPGARRRRRPGDDVAGLPLVSARSGARTRVPITRAGTPADTVPGGMSRVTTAPEPMTAPRPIETPARIVTPAPIQQSSAIETGARVSPCSRIKRLVSSNR
jgi:3-oxoacyl-[acyl-carrier protein] reductase